MLNKKKEKKIISKKLFLPYKGAVCMRKTVLVLALRYLLT